MLVIFSGNTDSTGSRVTAVYWESPDGTVTARLKDGSDRVLGKNGMADFYRNEMSHYTPDRVVEIDDLRTAFKYIGKSFDLVETMPEVKIPNAQPAAT